jgi:hypothetical protein
MVGNSGVVAGAWAVAVAAHADAASASEHAKVIIVSLSIPYLLGDFLSLIFRAVMSRRDFEAFLRAVRCAG